MSRRVKKQKNQINSVTFEDVSDGAKLMEEALLNDSFSGFLEKDQEVDGIQIRGSKQQTAKLIAIDLHGLTIQEAKKELSDVIAGAFSSQKEIYLEIITGRGRHSDPKLGPTLVYEAYEYVVKKYASQIVRIDPPPYESMLNGIALRGSFKVTLKL